MKLNPIVLSALAVVASSPNISAAPFPAGSGSGSAADAQADSVTNTPQLNDAFSPRPSNVETFARRASIRGGQRRSSAKIQKDALDVKTKRDLLASLTGGGGKPASDDQAMYQGQVTSGLTGLGLAPVAGPANTVLGTVNGLESGVQGTLNGLGLGAVNGVAKGVLGALNGVEDQVGNAVKGLGLPEPLGSTVGNVITTAKGVQGQTLSNLNVQLPVDPSTAAGSLQNPNAPGLGGVLGSVGGLEGQLNGLGLGGLGGTANGLLGTAANLPGQLGGSGVGGALGGLTGQLNGLGLGGLTGTLGGLTGGGNPLGAVNGLQGQLAALGLGGLGLAGGAVNGLSNSANGLLGTATGATSGLGLGNLVNGLLVGNGAMSSATDTQRQAEAQIQNNQSPLGILSDPTAVQKMIISQAQEIAHLEKLLQQQTQQAAVAASGRYPVSVANLPMDMPAGAVGGNAPIPGMSDTTNGVGENAGIFDSGMYNNRLAAPVTASNGTEDGDIALPADFPSTTDLPSTSGEVDTTPPPAEAEAEAASTTTTTSEAAPYSSSPAVTSASDGSTDGEIDSGPSGTSSTIASVPDSAASVVSSMDSNADGAKPTPFGPAVMKKLRKVRRDTPDDNADDVPGALDQTGSSLDPLASSAAATVHRYVESYQGPESPDGAAMPTFTLDTGGSPPLSIPPVETGVQAAPSVNPQLVFGEKGLWTSSKPPPLLRREAYQLKAAPKKANPKVPKPVKPKASKKVPKPAAHTKPPSSSATKASKPSKLQTLIKSSVAKVMKATSSSATQLLTAKKTALSKTTGPGAKDPAKPTMAKQPSVTTAMPISTSFGSAALPPKDTGKGVTASAPLTTPPVMAKATADLTKSQAKSTELTPSSASSAPRPSQTNAASIAHDQAAPLPQLGADNIDGAAVTTKVMNRPLADKPGMEYLSTLRATPDHQEPTSRRHHRLKHQHVRPTPPSHLFHEQPPQRESHRNRPWRPSRSRNSSSRDRSHHRHNNNHHRHHRHHHREVDIVENVET